jgi:beta-phosphoglucomutase family hydrolase
MSITTGTAARALIFDMDGVLVDSEPLHLRSYQTVLSDYGIKYTEADNQEFLGRKDYDCAAALIARFQLPVSAAQILSRKEEVLAELFQQTTEARPGVKRILAIASQLGLRLAVASMATSRAINIVVENLGIKQYFQTLTSGEEVQNGKPAPDIFQLAAKRLGISANNCLVIEDTINGIRAAKSAGMQCVAIPCQATQYQDHSEADLRLTSLNELNISRWAQSGELIGELLHEPI